MATALATDAQPTPTWGMGAGLGPWGVLTPAPGQSTAEANVAAQLHGGFAIRPPLWVEAEWALGVAAGGIRWAPRAQVTVLSPGEKLRPGLSAGVSYQGATNEASQLVPHWGLSLSARAKGPWVRVDLRHSLDATNPIAPTHHALGLLGLEWLPVRAPAPIVEAPPPPPPPSTPPPAFTITPAEFVWISHPLCAWVPAAEAPALIATAPGPVTVAADGYLPVVVDPKHPHDLVLTPAPDGGAVVVAAAPGDHVFVDGAPTPVSADGVAVANTPKDLVSVRVEGGGRTLTTELAPTDGWGVWYRASALPVYEVRFAQGSTVPAADPSSLVAELVRLSGDRRYVLQGSYSPEGRAESNVALARERAEVVRALFVAAGFPADRVSVLPVTPLESTDPAAARVVIVSSAAPETP